MIAGLRKNEIFEKVIESSPEDHHSQRISEAIALSLMRGLELNEETLC